MKIKFEYIKAKELQPGDLFMIGTDDAPPEMSKEDFNGGAAFSDIAIRLGSPCPKVEVNNEVCRITVEQ